MFAYNHLLHYWSVGIDKFRGTCPKNPLRMPTGLIFVLTLHPLQASACCSEMASSQIRPFDRRSELA